MKCSKCGTLLEIGSNICPNCQNVMTYHESEKVDDLNAPSITSNMNPPKLEINNDVNKKVEDISKVNEQNIYENNNVPIKKDETKTDNVNFSLPSSINVVKNADNVTNVQSIVNKKNKFNFNLKGNISAMYALIGFVVCLIVGLLLGKVLFTKTIISSATNCNMKNKLVANGKNNETFLNGYSYKIPTEYLYDKQDNGLLVYEKNGNIRIFLRMENALYDNIAVSKTTITETLKLSNISVNSVEERKINEHNYVIMELMTTDSKNRVVAITKYDNEHVFYIEIVDASNNFNVDVLSIADDIVHGIKKSDGASLESLDIYDTSKLVIKASNEYKALISN